MGVDGLRSGRTRGIALGVLLAMLALGPAGPVAAATTLDPTNPTANFTKEGGESFTPGTVLRLDDASVGDFVSFYAADTDAYPGTAIDVFTTFRVVSVSANGADSGIQVVINDGASRSAIAVAVLNNSVPGIGLLAQGGAGRFDPASYPVFVPVPWDTDFVSLRLRRHANGDAEIIEVNAFAVFQPTG